MITAVIIDDEAKGRITLQKMLEEFCPEVELLDMADDVLSGVKAVSTHQPDVVFLDIEMPNYSGFKLIEHFDEINFEVIFTTAYSEYAIKAFKVSAIAYLLKPIDINELQLSVERAIKIKANRQDDQRIESLKHNLTKKQLEKIVLPAQNGFLYLNAEEIKYFESKDRNTTIHLSDDTQQTTTESLRDCENRLKGTSFIRIHRSFIINLKHIKRYARGRDSFVQMDNDLRIDVGKNYKEDLNEVVSYFVK